MTAPSEGLGAGEQRDRETVAAAIRDAESAHRDRMGAPHLRFHVAAVAVLDALNVPALRARIAELEAERDKAREDCGFQRGIKDSLRQELDNFVRLKIAAEAERDALRAAVERVRALCDEADKPHLSVRVVSLDAIRAALDEAGSDSTRTDEGEQR